MQKRLGKYELLSKLGDGATSTVYLGRDPFAKREVAIKVATPEILRDPERGRLYTRLFLNEASLVGKLTHPHIVQIFDAVVTDDLCYIVMEYVPGGTLETYTHGDKLLPVDHVVELIFKCTRALEFAHRLGITHRDIKPANILMCDQHDIKISDFGSAITNTPNHRTVITGVGSPAYMSPEQIRERPLDHRTDIYSLGVVMHQLLTGELPFAGDTDYAIIFQVINTTPPLPSARRPDLPPILDRIVARAMARDTEARYPTWTAFAQDLAQAVRTGQLKRHHGDMPETEKFATLRMLPFFTDFTDVEIWEALRFAGWQRVDPGTIIMRDGEPGTAFGFVIEGELEVSKNGHRIATLGPGESFGEMAVIRRYGHERIADITAATDARVVIIRSEALTEASGACRMHFYQAFLETMADRLSGAVRHIASG
ncbi:MAG: cyclic nucleotide-binding domain-containing protein [Betaproteobacteria bacterium]|nr:cyclic nucleotide-binding domain-containing protein [Betaproteobacteria bacterium]